MLTDWLNIHGISLVVGLFGGGGLVTIILGILNRNKTQAEAEKIAAEAYGIQVSSAQKFTKSLFAEIEVLRGELKELRIKYDDINKKYLKIEDQNHRLKFDVDVLSKQNDELKELIRKYNKGL